MTGRSTRTMTKHTADTSLRLHAVLLAVLGMFHLLRPEWHIRFSTGDTFTLRDWFWRPPARAGHATVEASWWLNVGAAALLLTLAVFLWRRRARRRSRPGRLPVTPAQPLQGS